MGPSPKLRRACFNDYAQIASLESRHGRNPRSYEEWSHLWLDNSLYRELQPEWPIGWVLEDERRQIVGSVGNIPLAYEFQGKKIRTASGRSLVVEPAYRSVSLCLLDRLINQPGIDLYLNNTVSPNTAAALSVFDCSHVPVGVWDEAAFWITDYQAFMEGILTVKVGPLARLLSYPLSRVLFLKDRLTNGLHDSDVEIKTCSGFDERFDVFWMDLKRRNPHLLLAERTSQALDWHFKYALNRGHLWILTAIDGPRLAAYAIFERRDNPKFGLKRMWLVDFQSLDGSSALLSPILCAAVRKSREEGIHALENVGRWLEKGELIETAAPHRRKLSTWLYFYRANNSGLTESLKDRRAWAPSLLDGDASL